MTVEIFTPEGDHILWHKGQISLEDAQQTVGGWIEIVPWANKQILVNEEGLLIGLPANDHISWLLKQPIVGTAIVLSHDSKWT